MPHFARDSWMGALSLEMKGSVPFIVVELHSLWNQSIHKIENVHFWKRWLFLAWFGNGLGLLDLRTGLGTSRGCVDSSDDLRMSQHLRSGQWSMRGLNTTLLRVAEISTFSEFPVSSEICKISFKIHVPLANLKRGWREPFGEIKARSRGDTATGDRWHPPAQRWIYGFFLENFGKASSKFYSIPRFLSLKKFGSFSFSLSEMTGWWKIFNCTSHSDVCTGSIIAEEIHLNKKVKTKNQQSELYIFKQLYHIWTDLIETYQVFKLIGRGGGGG